MINNDAEFLSMYSPLIEKAVEYVMAKILFEHQKLIARIVYNANKDDPEEYIRTNQFFDSWMVEIQKTRDGAIGKMGQDTDVMVFESLRYQHGSFLSDSVAENLTEIIYDGLSGDLFGEGYWRKKRNAWAPLIRELDKRQLDSWFQTGLRKQGLKVVKG